MKAWMIDEAKLRRKLRELGHTGRRAGDRYVFAAVRIWAARPGQALVAELYEAVGREVGVSGKAAEKSMRQAMLAAWRWRHEQSLTEYLEDLRPPTLGAYVAGLAFECQAEGDGR